MWKMYRFQNQVPLNEVHTKMTMIFSEHSTAIAHFVLHSQTLMYIILCKIILHA